MFRIALRYELYNSVGGGFIICNVMPSDVKKKNDVMEALRYSKFEQQPGPEMPVAGWNP